MRRQWWIVAAMCACLALAGCAREPAPGAATAGRWDQARWDQAAWGPPRGAQ